MKRSAEVLCRDSQEREKDEDRRCRIRQLKAEKAKRTAEANRQAQEIQHLKDFMSQWDDMGLVSIMGAKIAAPPFVPHQGTSSPRTIFVTPLLTTQAPPCCTPSSLVEPLRCLASGPSYHRCYGTGSQ